MKNLNLGEEIGEVLGKGLVASGCSELPNNHTAWRIMQQKMILRLF
ncbi:hypothetical protein DFQ12_2967 [Sphingobacterium detergens]|uniref:Uncharacterized protein n=1 Tax=Sphingobacterium detergens TaxID=1145106 RepID=A0A420B7S1_SPHD1|nr:hypothetical protein DFQ12_2967 [Sphingobacterium detergens]